VSLVWLELKPEIRRDTTLVGLGGLAESKTSTICGRCLVPRPQLLANTESPDWALVYDAGAYMPTPAWVTRVRMPSILGSFEADSGFVRPLFVLLPASEEKSLGKA
jgi:hypothetical protein